MSLTITNLPEEIFDNITNFLETDEDLYACSLVCHSWHEKIIRFTKHQECSSVGVYIKTQIFNPTAPDLTRLWDESPIKELNNIKAIRLAGEKLREAVIAIDAGHLALSSSFINFFVSNILQVGFLDRALEEIDKSKNNNKDEEYKLVIKYLIENKYDFNQVIEIFKLLSVQAQSNFILLNEEIMNSYELLSLTKCLPCDENRDLHLYTVLSKMIKENCINLQNIDEIIQFSTINGKEKILIESFERVFIQNDFDLNLALSIVSLFYSEEKDFNYYTICDRLLEMPKPDFNKIQEIVNLIENEDLKNLIIDRINQKLL